MSAHLNGGGLYDGHDFGDRHSLRPGYESHDGSQYSDVSGGPRLSAWKPPPESRSVSNNYDGFDFNMGLGGDPNSHRGSHRISVNTGVRSHHEGSRNMQQDDISRHLLYETALMDTQAFEILEINEVDKLKKEHVRLNSKIEAAQRKLALESKVRDAAQNLQRLYSAKNRPDTPQSPESPKRSRTSLLGSRPRSGSRASSGGVEYLQQADSELAQSVKKVDQLHEMMKELLDQRQYVERKLLRHTAAVLAEEANKNVESAVSGLANGRHGHGEDDDDESVYTPNEFDGIRDILRGLPAGASTKMPQYEQQLASVQDRLEQLNSQLRNVISEAGQTLGKVPTAETALDGGEDSPMRLENRFVRLEDSLHALEQQQREIKMHYSRVQDDQYQTRNAVEAQLEGLNSQLHNTMVAASESQPVLGLEPPPQASGHGYQSQLEYMEENLMTMEQLLQQQHQTRNTVEEQLEGLNSQLHNALLTASESLPVPGLRQPPQADGQGYQRHFEYMEESLMTMEQLFQQQNQSLSAGAQEKLAEYETMASGAQQKLTEYESIVSSTSKKLSDYEATVGGLWDILQSESTSPRPDIYTDSDDDEPRAPPPPPKDSFSLQAFSSMVQSLFSKAQAAKEQQDILRRQIQQQRDLGGKSDAEKDREIADLHERHDELAQEHDALQQELANTIVKHEEAESHADHSRTELMNVMNEMDAIKKTMDAKQVERDDATSRLREQIQHLEASIAERPDTQQDMEDLESEVVRLTTELSMTKADREETAIKMREQVSQLEANMTEQTNAKTEMENLESEVVRLTTELVMAKAELDGAYGTRQERKGAQAAEVELLTEKNRNMSEHVSQLEQELQGMTNEFQELTKESIELEKEREQLDSLIDSLRERADTLEQQLNDEKLRWVGTKSPTGERAVGGGGGGRENTSMMVLRQEFKKMMRDQRMEGVKLLRAEQEERRKLESELRKLRQANGPLPRAVASSSGSGTPI
ncbi:hypothetical protein LTR37_000813 [Vermiconidia calcicola]|uniref:Uncharacterized protein n=1 Tax=Vermiconidia calcicola TaxID=1690605 RepID=A0ACC3NYP6_9PEZI|nr:hypothetical protein LTR37_000813 [Vermiconidia calcicola]